MNDKEAITQGLVEFLDAIDSGEMIFSDLPRALRARLFVLVALPQALQARAIKDPK